MEAQRIKNSQNKFKKNKMEEGKFAQPNVSDICRAIENKTVVLAWEESNKPKECDREPQTDACVCGNLNFDQDGTTNQWGKAGLFIKLY